MVEQTKDTPQTNPKTHTAEKQADHVAGKLEHHQKGALNELNKDARSLEHKSPEERAAFYNKLASHDTSQHHLPGLEISGSAEKGNLHVSEKGRNGKSHDLYDQGTDAKTHAKPAQGDRLNGQGDHANPDAGKAPDGDFSKPLGKGDGPYQGFRNQGMTNEQA